NHKAFSRFCLCGHEKSGLVLKLFSIKALLGEAKNSLAILMGRTLKIAQLFAHRLQKVAHSLGALWVFVP
ncbi:hypothetical protein, partial [Pseudomonas aeruginosa]|uniref:hypothetical protein n=1 Tax=Pseudomonas aeruginosa TaxID=287 RepID=UPI001E504C3E